jgi:hypothetical protein
MLPASRSSGPSPLVAASISLAAGLALSFVRHAGYRGHEIDDHRPEGRRLRLV